MARVRSPNYPAISLPAAIDRIRKIHDADARNAIPREVVAKHLGFGGLNGASATVISALNKYDLLETVGNGETRVSDLAMTILFPHDETEKQEALEKAAFRPALFAKLRERWPDHPPSDDSLRAYLKREGFSSGAVDQVIQFYRETLEIASSQGARHDSQERQQREPDLAMTSAPANHQMQPPLPLPSKSGRPFTIGFDGDVLTGTIAIRSVRDIDRLVKVLEAQKVAIEAMQEDSDSGDHGAEH